MTDRDIPSVPVTTLAGLNSLSDLLSELPVSDSLNNVAQLNKSLLFHTLVANESANLLSVRDDNLVRQLVNAIEQTNSDNIELKPQFAIHQHGANISTYPELLQGIYNFRPTVFNTPQHIPNHQIQQQQQHHITEGNEPNVNLSVSSNQFHANTSTSAAVLPQQSITTFTDVQQQQHNLATTDQSKLRRTRRNLAEQNETLQQQQQQQNVILQQQQTTHDICMQENVHLATDTHYLQQQQQQQPTYLPETIINTQQQQPQQQQQLPATVIHQQQQQQPHMSVKDGTTIYMQHSQPQQQQQQFNSTYQMPYENVQQQQQHPQQQAVLQQELQMQQQQQWFQQQKQQQHKQQIQNSSPIKIQQSQQQQQQIPTIQGNFQNVLNAQRQHLLDMQQKTVLPTRNNGNEYLQQQQQTLLQQQNTSIDEHLRNDNIKANEQQQHNMMMTSATTTTTLIRNDDGTTTTGGNLSENHTQGSMPGPNVKLRSPEMAIKMGILASTTTTTTQQQQQKTTTTADTFTMMKADEKRTLTTAVKRKPQSCIEDLPPEEIYTKPKVRRVERITSGALPKCSKEEVMRSQTYQQFMRNMEQIIELLDDTETPNFDSDEVDENIECISAKMLTTMSNDVAKLKAKQVLDSIPKNKLTLLINYAMRNVYLAKNYAAGPDVEDEIVDDDVMEKILNAIEACLLVCNIYSTAKDLKFLQEDNISMIIKFIQFQMHETIFPSYDAVYTVKSMKKADNRRKGKSAHNHSRNLQLLYSKAVELMKVFVTLFDKCVFVDTIVLPLSTLAIEPFFVDNIETLQFVCLELVTTIFRKEQYSKIRSSILSDILSSIDRLPSSKRNLRPFKLTNNGGNIQMVTALVLQLIQCATILPDALSDSKARNKVVAQQIMDDEVPGGTTRIGKPNHDVMVLNKYDVAVSIGGNFLTTFLNKCKTRSNDTDFRPLFENFIHDLLATVNKPEWPASELLLSLLGTMLVRYVSNKTIEPSIRLVSLDYLGIVAARLRKDTVESRCKVNIIDAMIKSIKAEQEKEGDLVTTNCSLKVDPEEERTEFLQKILLDFLAVNAHEENLIWDYARHFYLAQWYRDIIAQRRRIIEGKEGYASRKKNSARKKRKKAGASSESSSESEHSEHDDSGEENNTIKNGRRNSSGIIDQELNLEIFNILEERKKYLLNSIRPSSQQIKTYIDYNNAHLIAQYLATKRPFSQSFDGYLKKIILVVNEPSIGIRTRAMKCLANIVEVDPMVLKRKDMQMGVNQKFLDAAISVREAAVDLVGKFVLSNEELIDQYYDMLSTRILDTGVSVRKRVIKILRDICIEYPDFDKIPEICVKMIRRVHDEEGIQKLVTEVFMKMWFSPCRKDDKHGIQRKINQIIDVVNTAHDTGTTWLEGLLTSIFQPKENMMKLDGSAQEPVKKNTEPPAEIVLACQQLADGLVDRLIELEDTDNARMLGCITTLHLLAKVRPQLLVRHAITIEPYLNIKCHASTAPKFICAVADILEKVVPMVNYASESFLASLEEHLMLLVVSLNQAVVTSCVSCLGALVNKITKNYKLIRDCFQKFYRILDHSKNQLQQHQNEAHIYTPMFRRSLFTIGILMRYFDFKSPQVIGEVNGLSPTICDETFDCLMFFTQCSNKDICKQALISLGSFCVMNDDYLTRPELKQYYCDLLHSPIVDAGVKIICMRNIWIYLTESEMYMHNKEKEWEKQSKNDDLKEMNDVSSGMASRIIQLYLQEILDCFLHPDDAVRLWAVKVVQIVLRQGLVHPVRMVPYLICLSTDCKLESAHRADALLKDIDKTYAGFVNMKVQFGLQLCFELQEILQSNRNVGKNANIVRGYTKKPADVMPSALNDFLYTLLRTTKPQRRALVQTVTKQFDDQKTSLRQMLYIADNLAYFPYVVQDEPLYLIHQIDLLISMAGTNLLSTFKECLQPGDNSGDVLADDDDEEDPDVLFRRLPLDTTEIQKCITSAQACMLLLILKEHLKDMYSLTDGKISRYSPSEQKIYEKAVTRKQVADFNPKSTIELIRQQQEQKLQSGSENFNKQLSDAEKANLVQKYLDFKQLMLKLDPDDDSDEETKKVNNTSQVSDTTPNTSFLNSTGANYSSMDDSSLGGAGGHSSSTNPPTTPHRHNYNAINSIEQTSSTPFKDGNSPRLTRNVMAGKGAPISYGSSSSNAHSMYMTTPAAMNTAARKQTASKSKRKKRKMVSSDEDSEEDLYDDE